MADVWEQQPGESHAAYSAFLFYRGRPAPRSVVEAYREWAQDPTKKKTSGRWAKWCAEYHWIDRATAHDLHLERIRRAATEKAVAEVHEQHARERELSHLSVLKETASLAHAAITDVVDWDEQGRVTVKPAKRLPRHVAAAIQKVSLVHDKQGNPNLTVEMHPKVRPLELLGQHFHLWDSEKQQAEHVAAAAFLELLNLIRSGALDELDGQGPPPSLRNPPPGIVIEIEALR